MLLSPSLAVSDPQRTGSGTGSGGSGALGDTHRLLCVNFLQDKKAKKGGLRGVGEPGEGVGWGGGR